MTELTFPFRLSIALVTRNRPHWLRQCLESWRAQDVQPFEIIISDDSDDSMRPEIQRIAIHFGCHWIPGPRRGLYANRNHAFLASRGSHVMSADDDHTHPAGFVDTIVNAVKSDSEAIWTLSEWTPGYSNGRPTAPGELRSDGTVGPPENPSCSAAIACGSTVYPRIVFNSGYLYDETYCFGGVWYLWGHQLRKAGFRITHIPNTFVWHHSETWIEWGRDRNVLKAKTEADLYTYWSVARLCGYPPKFSIRLFTSTIRALTFGMPQTPDRKRVRISLSSAQRAVYLSLTKKLEY